MEQLEQAANIIMAPPNGVTVEDRGIAENIILQFRSTENPYILCRQILESSKNEYVLYEAANLIGCSVAKEWRDICHGQGLELKQYLLQYLASNPHIFHSVREHILKTLAFIIEREETPVSEKDKYYGEIVQLLNSGDPNMVILACCMVQTTCQEKVKIVVSCSKLVDDADSDVHKKFETHYMLEMYESLLKLLSEIGENTVVKSELMPALLKLVLLAEEILTWPFMHVKEGANISYGEAVHMKTGVYSHGLFDPYPEWKTLVLSENTILLFFRLYEKFKDDWQLGHHLMICLVQLSSLSGRCVEKTEDNFKYIRSLCTCLHHYLLNNLVKETEALGIATIIMKISLNHKLQRKGILSSAMDVILRDTFMLTVQFIQGSAEERHTDPEDQLYTEALDKILIAIDAIDSNVPQSGPSRNFLQPFYSVIFRSFMKHHLSPPNGARIMAGGDNEEIREESQPDYILYSIQISLITHLGANKMEDCLTDLSDALEASGCKLKNLLSCKPSNELAFLEVYEDIYWLLMISGQLISDPSNIDLLKNYLHAYGLDKQDTDQRAHLSFLTHLVISNPDKRLDEHTIKINRQEVNPFIRMMAAIFYIWHLDIEAAAKNNEALMSPEVANTLIWLMRKFYNTCFRMNCFSQYFATDLYLWMVNFAVDAVRIMLQKRSSEQTLVDNYSKFLYNLAGEDRCFFLALVVKVESFPGLITLSQTGELANTSPSAQKGLLMGLVHCGRAFDNEADAQKYWMAALLDPFINEFRSLVRSADFFRTYSDELTKRRVLYHLDNFAAISSGVHVKTINCIFTYLEEALKLSLVCLNFYHNYLDVVEGVMTLFSITANCASGLLKKESIYKFYRLTFEMLEIFSRHNIDKREYNSTGDEDKCVDLLHLMEILCYILDIYIAPGEVCHVENPLEAYDVCIYGLHVIFPLVNTEVMKNPDICYQFFNLLKEMASKYLEYMIQRKEILERLLPWVEVGLSSYGTEISCIVLELQWCFCEFLMKNKHHVLYEIYKPFLMITLTLIFLQEISSDALNSSFFGVCGLISLYKDDFNTFMKDVIQSQSSHGIQAKLYECHEMLISKPVIGSSLRRSQDKDLRSAYNQLLSLVHMCNMKSKYPSGDFNNRFSMKNLSMALSSS